MEYAANPLVGVYRNRALFHDHLVAGDVARNPRDHRLNIGKIGSAGVSLRGAHGDEDRLTGLDGAAQVSGELHGFPPMLGQQLGQMLFVNRYPALT